MDQHERRLAAMARMVDLTTNERARAHLQAQLRRARMWAWLARATAPGWRA